MSSSPEVVLLSGPGTTPEVELFVLHKTLAKMWLVLFVFSPACISCNPESSEIRNWLPLQVLVNWPCAATVSLSWLPVVSGFLIVAPSIFRSCPKPGPPQYQYNIVVYFIMI